MTAPRNKPEMAGDCPQALERLYEYLDGELTDSKLAEVSQHLAECYPCKDRADFERHLRDVIRTCARATAPEGLLEKVRTRMREGKPRVQGRIDV